ncbi:MAG: hypothetical protein ACRDRA_14685 [Pseudonocardiaceae bacterium]
MIARTVPDGSRRTTWHRMQPWLFLLETRGTAAIEVQLVVEAAHFVRPDWALVVDGLDGCRQMLGMV